MFFNHNKTIQMDIHQKMYNFIQLFELQVPIIL